MHKIILLTGLVTMLVVGAELDAQAPAQGSRRIGQLLGIEALQWKRVGKTKLWFWYVEQPTHIDVIRLVSTEGTGFFYVTKKNPRTKTEKLELKKYDPVARKHVAFREAKIK